MLRLASRLVFTAFLLACTQVTPTNPYDPEAPAGRQAAGRVSGRLVAPEGFDLAQLVRPTLALRPLDVGAETATATPDAEGGFVFADVPPGAHRLLLSVAPLVGPELDVLVPPGARVALGDVPLSAPEVAQALPWRRITGRAARLGAEAQGHGGIAVALDGTPYGTVTFPGGDFAVAAPPGLYALTFSAAGYGAEVQPNVRLGAEADTELAAPVVLVGQPAAVQGTVRLLDVVDADTLRARVDITLTRADGTLEAATRPDAAGRFALTGLGTGQGTIRFSLDGFAETTVAVDLEPGANLGLGDVDLHPSPVGLLSGTAHLAGADALGHAGIRVQVAGRGESALTSAEGAFSLSLPGGLHELIFSRTGHAVVRLPGVRVTSGGAEALTEVVVLPADPGGVRGLVQLPVGFDTAERRRRVEIELRPADASADAPPTRTVRALDDGSFAVPGLTAGAWRLDATLLGFEGAHVEIVVEPGVTADADTLVLHAAEVAPGESPTRVTGTVRLAEVADPDGHGGVLIAAETTALSTVTNSAGRFELVGLPTDQPYTLTFHRAGHGTLAIEVHQLAREEAFSLPEPVVLPALPGTVRGAVTLSRFGTPAALAGVGVALFNAAGVLVDTTRPDAAAVVEGGGAPFELRGLAAGDYTLVVSATGYRAERAAVIVVSGRRTEVGGFALMHDSQTDGAARFIGRVRLGEAAEHGGSQVRVWFADRDVVLATAVTDAVGVFDVPASASEAYRLEVGHPGFAAPPRLGPFAFDADSARFVDADGRPPEVTLVPAPLGGRISVRFTLRPAWLPADVRRADIRVVGPAGTASLNAAAEGVAHAFGGLAPGPYVVRVERAGFTPYEALVELDLGRPTVDLDAVVLSLQDLGAARIPLEGETLSEADLPPEIRLVGADLSGVRLTGDFTTRDLSGADLSGANLSHVDLSGARLRRANLFGADLTEAELSGADLSGATLVGADLTGASLVDAQLDGANLSEARLVGAQFVPEDLDAAHLPAPPCDVDPAHRPGARMAGSVFAGADLSGADLRGVYMPGADLAGARLADTDLRRACLRGVRLTLTDVSGAHLDEADLRDAQLANVVLQGTTLRGADLTGANLVGAVLERADLGCVAQRPGGLCTCEEPFEAVDAGGVCVSPARADWLAHCGCRTRLGGVNLAGANLVGAQLSGADLAEASLVGVAIGDALAPPDFWPADCVLPEDCVFTPGADCVAAAGRICNVTQTRFVEARLDRARLAAVALNHVDLTGASLRGADLANARFFADSTYREATFAGADLTAADLTGADLGGVDFEGARLLGTRGRGVDLRGASFRHAHVESVDFDGLHRGATFEGAVLRGAMEFAPGAPADLRHADLSNVRLQVLPGGARLDGARLRGLSVNLYPARDLSFRAADLRGFGGLSHLALCDLSGADLRGELFDAEWTSLRLPGADLSAVGGTIRAAGCDLAGARFDAASQLHLRAVESDLAGASFAGAGLGLPSLDPNRTTWFHRVDLDGADFTGADLGFAELTQVDLRGVQALPARLAGATLVEVDGRGLDWSDVAMPATMWDQADLRDARMAAAGLRDARFDRALMQGATFAGAEAPGASFTVVDLFGVVWRDANLAAARLFNTSFAQADTLGANLQGLISSAPYLVAGQDVRGGLPAGPLCGGNLARVDARGFAGWPRRDIRGANFQAARLAGGDLSPLFMPADGSWDRLIENCVRMFADTVSFATADLAGTTLSTRAAPRSTRGASFRGADLTGAGLDGLVFTRDTSGPMRGGGDLTEARFADAPPGSVSARCDGCVLRGGSETFVRISSGAVLNSDLKGADLRGVNLAGRSVQGTDFSGADLTGADLENLDGDVVPGNTPVRLRRARLDAAHLTGAHLLGAVLTDASLRGADLVGADLTNAFLTCADLSGVQAAGASLAGAVVLGCLDLTDADLRGADLSQTYLKGATLDGADLSYTSLWSEDGPGQDLSDTSMRGIDFTGAALDASVFRRADLTGASLVEVAGRDTDFSDAALTEAALRGATLVRARFAFADLARADLSEADLRGASFWRADLSGADLRGARLAGARFTGAVVEGAQVCRSAVVGLGADVLGAPAVDEGC